MALLLCPEMITALVPVDCCIGDTRLRYPENVCDYIAETESDCVFHNLCNCHIIIVILCLFLDGIHVSSNKVFQKLQ